MGPSASSPVAGNTFTSTQNNAGSGSSQKAKLASSTTKTFFGVKVSLKTVPSATVQRTATVPRDARAMMKVEEKQKLYTSFIAAKESGIIEIQEVGSSQETIEHTYDTQVMLEGLEAYLALFDMKTTFKHVVKPKKNYFGNTVQEVDGKSRDLFVDYNHISMSEVVASCNWWTEWVYNKRDSENLWIPQDLTWSADLLKAKMSDEMFSRVKDDLRSLHGLNINEVGGPVILKAILERLMSSNLPTIRALQASLSADKLSLEECNNDLLTFCNRTEAAVRRLQSAGTVDKYGNVLQSYVPENLSDSLYKVLQTTGVEAFDKAFASEEERITVQGMMHASTTITYPSPLKVIEQAKNLYRHLSIAGKWVEQPANPTAFPAVNLENFDGTCFGCGRKGCRKDSSKCPQFGKDPTDAGKAAKKAFWDSKKKKKSDGTTGTTGNVSFPARPTGTDPKEVKLQGKWYFYKFNESKWKLCSDQSDAAHSNGSNDSSQQSANLATETGSPNGTGPTSNAAEPGGFLAALTSFIPEGADPNQVALQQEYFLQQVKSASDQFKSKMADL